MTQSTLNIPNSDGATFRAANNSALQALGSTSKGSSAPSTPYAGQLWLDDDTPSSTVWRLNMFDGTDWIALADINTSSNTATAYVGGTLASTTAFKIIATTYDASTTGSLVLTGAGFSPKYVEISAAINGTSASSEGWYDGSANASISSNHNNAPATVATSSAYCGALLTAAITQALLVGASLDADGVTLTKTKSGSPTGTVTVFAKCFR